MTRFIHLTDLHVSHPDAGDPSDKTNAIETLHRVVGIINAMEPQPDFVVASGDLTNLGDAQSYDLVQEILAPLEAPLVLALGNHDKRPEFHTALGKPASQTPYCHDTTFGGLHVITLDTLVAERVAGAICDVQFDFLEKALERHADLPKLIVMHHPPLLNTDDLPWGSLDMDSTNKLKETLQEHNVAGILCGHIHINRVSQWHGIPVVVSNGLDSTIDLLDTQNLRQVEGTGFAICDWRPSGLSVSFVPLSPAPREIAVIDRATLLSFT
ncbi:3',5'-cyclic AMP phosphodiesterase CpdA [Sulfitobacter undariae]|uniref:3',5'-cyclic AMP phosphodiesterase CpdA n=1 Tax=Sulfitobacter undariae TaxID=1563671 RepID=A0A7W6EA63_9RHOB|nr:metallophosphoesterase [Sulfitobacter undariae]MBB3995457.1 3',5'-cyclic AMP phosphodiesterase CpdA [Sulfitobacter undariae]